MNPLQEYPHLFANGEFGIKTSRKSIYSIGGDELLSLNSLQYYTLIARPIEDMTDEECAEWGNTTVELLEINQDFDHIKQGVNRKIDTKTLEAVELLWLLERGLYPFDQSHFDDGTVIDVNDI